MTLQEIIFALERFWSERGLPHPPALGRRGRRRHDAPGDLLPRARPAALAGRLRAALAAPRRRPLRREPEPALQARAVPGHPEAAPGGHPGAVPRPRSRPSASTPRCTTCASRRTTGSRRRSGRGASAGRCCSTARRSPSSPTSSRRAASTSRRSPARSPTGSSASRCTCRTWTDVYDLRWSKDTPLPRRAPRGGVPALALLLRARRRRAAPADRSTARSPRAGACSRRRAGAPTCRPTTGRSRARTPSTCSTRAAPSR